MDGKYSKEMMMMDCADPGEIGSKRSSRKVRTSGCIC